MCEKKDFWEGTSETEFSPDKYMRRGMFVTVLARLSGEELPAKAAGFSDIDDNAYYASSVAWAVQHKIVNGEYDAQFGPDEFITREQLCVMLDRYAAYQEEQAKIKKEGVTSFTDEEEISPWARESVTLMVQSNVVNGTTDGCVLTSKLCHSCRGFRGTSKLL